MRTQSHGLFRTLAPDADRIRVVNAYANAVNRPVRRTGSKLAGVTVLRYEYLLVDEISMMREKFYAMLCHIKRALPGIKIVLIGDYLQLRSDKLHHIDVTNSDC